jgi:hypothetical protein
VQNHQQLFSSYTTGGNGPGGNAPAKGPLLGTALVTAIVDNSLG